MIKIAISCGDAAGISYEIVFKALQRFSSRQRSICFLVVGDWKVASFTLKYLRLDLELRLIKSEEEIDFAKQRINFIDIGLIKNFSRRDVGQINALFGRASLRCVEKAYELIKDKKADCLITAPINKEAICLSQRDFRGHTEFLAGLSNVRNIAMMIAGRKLKVALVTRHIPLKKVSGSLDKRGILSVARLVDSHLRKFCSLRKPKIGLCALNPHAGEGGVLGKEEKEIIVPAVKEALGNKINLVGPLPADSVFEKAYNKREFDAVICLYHDQGLIPLKMVERDRAVNITLGLPFVRTSPAHGTAYDIAYRHKAKSDSFFFAVQKAVEMVNNAGNFK